MLVHSDLLEYEIQKELRGTEIHLVMPVSLNIILTCSDRGLKWFSDTENQAEPVKAWAFQKIHSNPEQSHRWPDICNWKVISSGRHFSPSLPPSLKAKTVVQTFSNPRLLLEKAQHMKQRLRQLTGKKIPEQYQQCRSNTNTTNYYKYYYNYYNCYTQPLTFHLLVSYVWNGGSVDSEWSLPTTKSAFCFSGNHSYTGPFF